MNIFHAVILGVVEGVTEFLPVSSTFHLIFSARVLGVQQNDFTKLFEVFIQSGAILSVALLYLTDVVKYKEISKRVIVSFIPTALAGLILYKFIKNVLFENQILMIFIFAVVGGLFLLIEQLVKKDRLTLTNVLKNLSYREALIIGLIQALAVIPGVSRAGAVIVIMMILKYKRDQAAYYSFLLSIPTIFAAAFYDLYKMRQTVAAYSYNWILLAAGFAAALISSYFVVKWLINYLKKNSLSIFGYYRLIIAIILMLIYFR